MPSSFFRCLEFAKKTCPFMRGRSNKRRFGTYFLFYIFCSIYIKKKGDLLMARSSRLESGFQDKLQSELKEMFPGCMTFKMDQIQGIPDILVLYENKWASLECKRSANAKRQPNQEYYVDKMNKMSFSRFIYPENKEAVLDDLRKTFQP